MKLSQKAQASLSKVVEQFESGDLSPLTRLILLEADPDDNMPSNKWTLANRIMAFIQSGGELDCRGFKQWKSVNRSVKKGSSAVYILGPCTRKIEDTKSGEERMIVTGFRTIPVFPLYETEGEDLEEFCYEPASPPRLIDVAERMGVAVEYGPTAHRNAAGWYSPKSDAIRLGTHEEATFFHELAHAAHKRVDNLAGSQDEQETIAEFAACVLSEMYGVRHTGNAWDYIKHFSEDPLTAIYKAVSTVEKIMGVLFPEEDPALA